MGEDSGGRAVEGAGGGPGCLLTSGNWGTAIAPAASRAHNSAVECVLHTDEVAGSIPAAPTGIVQDFSADLGGG